MVVTPDIFIDGLMLGVAAKQVLALKVSAEPTPDGLAPSGGPLITLRKQVIAGIALMCPAQAVVNP